MKKAGSILISKTELEKFLATGRLYVNRTRIQESGANIKEMWKTTPYEGGSPDSYVVVNLKERNLNKKLIRQELLLDDALSYVPLTNNASKLLAVLRNYRGEQIRLEEPKLSAEDILPQLENRQHYSVLLTRAERLRLDELGYLVLDNSRVASAETCLEELCETFPDVPFNSQNVYLCSYEAYGGTHILEKNLLTKDLFFGDNSISHGQLPASDELRASFKRVVEARIFNEREASSQVFTQLFSNYLPARSRSSKVTFKECVRKFELTEREERVLSTFWGTSASSLRAASLHISRSLLAERKKELTLEKSEDLFSRGVFFDYCENNLKDVKPELEKLRKLGELQDSVFKTKQFEGLAKKYKEAEKFYLKQTRKSRTHPTSSQEGGRRQKCMDEFSFAQLVFFYKYSSLFAQNKPFRLEEFSDDLAHLEKGNKTNLYLFKALGSYLSEGAVKRFVYDFEKLYLD